MQSVESVPMNPHGVRVRGRLKERDGRRGEQGKRVFQRLFSQSPLAGPLDGTFWGRSVLWAQLPGHHEGVALGPIGRRGGEARGGDDDGQVEGRVRRKNHLPPILRAVVGNSPASDSRMRSVDSHSYPDMFPHAGQVAGTISCEAHSASQPWSPSVGHLRMENSKSICSLDLSSACFLVRMCTDLKLTLGPVS